MHILFCTHDMDSGGSARSLSILIEHLAKKHKITLISLIQPTEGKNIAKRYASLGITVYIVPWGWLPVDLVGCPVNIEVSRQRSASLQKHKASIRAIADSVDVICFNGYPSSSLASVFPAAIPKYLIAREVLEKDSPGYPSVSKYLRSQIRKAIAIGPVEARQLDAMGIPNITIFNTGPRMPICVPMPENPIRFGVFTQIVPCKGLNTLANAVNFAASALRSHGASVHLFGGSVGGAKGPLELELQQFIDTNHLQDVFFLRGWSHSVEEDMNTMHCLVRPDRTGSPWGRDIIEAMSLGRPVVSTGTEDVFVKNGKTGWLVPPGEYIPLGKILASLSNSKNLLALMGEEAFAFARENFDPETNMSRIENILTSSK